MGFRFNYGVPGAGVPGQVADMGSCLVDTYLSAESGGIEPGSFVFEIPDASPLAQRRTVERTITSTGRKIAGVALYVPGRPREVSRATWEQYDAVPIVRRGRIWVLCENLSATPEAATDSFWIRKAASPTPTAAKIAGNLRYGNGDLSDGADATTATCVQIATGNIRVIRTGAGAVSGVTLCEIEFDFTAKVAFA